MAPLPGLIHNSLALVLYISTCVLVRINSNVLTHLTILVFHHDGCRLVHLTMLSLINAIRHQDRCRFVHPAKWDISSMPYTIMTNADWCIPPSGTLDNFGLPS